MIPQVKSKNSKKIKNVFFKIIILERNCYDADLIIILTEWDEFKSIDFKSS